jgi:hypothetical protein
MSRGANQLREDLTRRTTVVAPRRRQAAPHTATIGSFRSYLCSLLTGYLLPCLGAVVDPGGVDGTPSLEGTIAWLQQLTPRL